MASDATGDTTAAARPLAGRVALVTGGARGIGRATAHALAGAGADVAVLDRLESEAREAATAVAELGVRSMPVVLDLSEIERIPAAVDSVVDQLGTLDILVNCAGIEGGPGGVLDLDLATWERVHRIDLTAPFFLMQRSAQRMIDGGRGGRIVNVTSSSAFRASLTQIDYTSAKAALVGITRSAAAQLAPHDINVNCVAPGMTVTSMADGIDPEVLQGFVSSGPLENLFHRLSMPEDVAAAILFLCLPGSRQITAQTIHTSAGSVV